MARKKPKLAPALLWVYLQSTDGIRAVEASIRSEQLRRLRRERRRLERAVPSSTWLEAAWERGEPLPTGWLICKGCGRGTPPPCVGSSGHCDDCRLGDMSPEAMAMLPSSRSGIAIRAAAEMGVRIDGME